MDRRSFIGTMPVIGLLGSRAKRLDVGGAQHPKSEWFPVVEEIGVQLYTLRSLLSQDVDRTFMSGELEEEILIDFFSPPTQN